MYISPIDLRRDCPSFVVAITLHYITGAPGFFGQVVLKREPCNFVWDATPLELSRSYVESNNYLSDFLERIDHYYTWLHTYWNIFYKSQCSEVFKVVFSR